LSFFSRPGGQSARLPMLEVDDEEPLGEVLPLVVLPVLPVMPLVAPVLPVVPGR
jgi:hypothetical protein